MKKYTKILTLLLGVGIGIGASGFMGNINTDQRAYANDRIGYSNLSGNYEEYPENYGDNYDENCYRDNSRGCGRGSMNNYSNQNYGNQNYRGSDL